MKKDELKLRAVNMINDLIDTYFSDNTIIDKMANSTLKVIVKMNVDKMDSVIDLMADKDGNVDADSIAQTYADQIGSEGLKLDIKQYVKSDLVRNLLPDKFLLITRDDIMKIAENDGNKTLIANTVQNAQCAADETVTVPR